MQIKIIDYYIYDENEKMLTMGMHEKIASANNMSWQKFVSWYNGQTLQLGNDFRIMGER